MATENVGTNLPGTPVPATTGVAVNPSFDPTVEVKDAVFRFKKDKMDYKRPNVELKIPVPSVIGLKEIMEKGGKGLELLVETAYDVVRSVAADIVANNKEISQENFPFSQISWEAIANMERADRRSVTIPEETWTGFATDYMNIMPGVTGKNKEAIELAVAVYLKKFSQVKTNKDVLKKLQEQLGLYMEHTKNGDEFVEILELLTRRVENYLKADEPQILAENL